jgi:hypothetical protein
MAHGLTAAASAPPSSEAADGTGPRGKQPGSEDVIDAEFKRAG